MALAVLVRHFAGRAKSIPCNLHLKLRWNFLAQLLSAKDTVCHDGEKCHLHSV